MKFFIHKFRKNKLFLTSYFLIQMVVILSLAILFYNYPFVIIDNVSFKALIFFIPFAFFLGIKIPTIMHNCFHNNLGSRSFIIGELTSVFVLLSYGIMCINHTFHHVHADTKLDPHNPEGKPFWIFLLTASFSGMNIIENDFLSRHGNSKFNRFIFKFNIFLHCLGIAVRIAFWYFLLGEQLFFMLYVPAFAFYFYTFAHVNYYTHVKGKDGNVMAINRNSNVWYKIVNFLGDGVYFHANHHKNPGLYNPMKWKTRI